MQLTLHQLIPIPLRDQTVRKGSEIWGREVAITSGEQVFVKAPSGTGKTTLIYILYGLRRDYEGAVRWGATELKGLDGAGFAALRAGGISIVFQDLRLFPGLTTWENLDIKRQLNPLVTEAQLEEWLARLGIIDKKQALAATLSYGEQQRVAIIRALLQPFNWLLMDEPFSHLDHENTRKAIGLIKEVTQERKAGLLLADLDDNQYFSYNKTLLL